LVLYRAMGNTYMPAPVAHRQFLSALALASRGDVPGMTPEFAKVVKELLAKGPDGYTLSVSKDTLLKLSDEEREFIERRVIGYWRGDTALSPRSFREFLGSADYWGNDKVWVYIRAEDLVNAGFLKLTEKDGFYYWVLADGKPLNPKKFIKLYEADERTFRTLMKEYGYLDIYEAFGVKTCRWALGEFEYGNVYFELYGKCVRAVASYDINGKQIKVDACVQKPTADDIRKLAEHVKGLAKQYDAVAIAKQVLEWLRSEDYEVTYFSISLTYGGAGKALKKLEVELYQKEGEGVLTARVGAYLAPYIASLFLLKVLDPAKLDLPPGFRYEDGVFWYKATLSGLEDLWKLSDAFAALQRLDGLLFDAIGRYLKRVANRRVAVLGLEIAEGKPTVRDVLDAISWDPTASLDEVALKLMAVKEEFGEFCKPPVLEALLSQAVLRGHPEGELTKRLEEPLETLLWYMLEGRLKVRYVATPEGAGVPRLYLDGKDIGVEVEKLPKFKKMVIVALALLAEEGEEEAGGDVILSSGSHV